MVHGGPLVLAAAAALVATTTSVLSQPDPTRTPGQYLNEKHQNIYTKDYKLPISVSHEVHKAPLVSKGGLVITYEEPSGTYTIVPRGAKLGQNSKLLATAIYSNGKQDSKSGIVMITSRAQQSHWGL